VPVWPSPGNGWLTVSDADEDVVRSYDLHANPYVTKPAEVGNFHETIRKIDDFFVTVVRRPPRNPGGQIKTLIYAEL
jgi:hypothetical protein